MKNTTPLGMNRTGVGMSPIDSQKMTNAPSVVSPPPMNGHSMEATRKEFSSDSEPIGAVPPPTTLKGVAKTAAKMVMGENPTIFIDKLGERLGFERTGTRLYEAILAKYDALGSWDGGPDGVLLRQFHDDELRHMKMIQLALQQIGADPTVMTPAADIAGVESSGLMQVLTDPRTSMPLCLHALLVAELTDNEGWQMLIQLATAMGYDQLATQFTEALNDEQNHLNHGRRWTLGSIQMQATGTAKVTPPPAS
jgi:hypothetical protein